MDTGSGQGTHNVQVSELDDSAPDFADDLRPDCSPLLALLSPSVSTLLVPLPGSDHGNHTLLDSFPNPSVHSCIPPMGIY